MNPSSTLQPLEFGTLSILGTMPIVIVDDPQGPLSQIAHKAGYHNILTTANPYEAIEHVRQHDTDLFMLHLNDQDVDMIQFIKTSVPERFFPILALLSNNENKQRALKIGAQDVLENPFDESEAELRIHNLLATQRRYKDLVSQKQDLEKQMLERSKQLEIIQVEMLTRLAKAAEYRDDENDQHIWRVAKTSALLAKELRLSDEQVDLILRSARLHDVGKIAMPDGLLFKPTPLSESEFEVIKSHTVIGAQILSGGQSRLMKMAETIAISHHERWDGSGYPKGLKGEAIAVEGRILALADTFDVLTHDRVYRRAISVDDAATEIKKQRGKQFDPLIVDAFVGLLRKKKLPVDFSQ
jgi:putative two-component system response regulator